MNNKIWIYDIESFSNFFSYYAINKDTSSEVFFYIHEDINELQKLFDHLNNDVKTMIGFNNINYDYPLLHKIIQYNKIINAQEIYKISQDIINSEYSRIWENQHKWLQVDLFLIKHYDNPAKRSSLKWLEFTQRWNKLQDLPFKHYDTITKDQIQIIKDYNKNDVLATKMFYEKECLNDIAFRKRMSKKLNKNILNMSDVSIGEYINQITYEKLSGKNYSNFKKKRTYYKSFKLSDIIPSNIRFETRVFKDFYNDIKDKTFYPGQEFDRIIKLPNISLKFAKGGLHSEDIPRIIKNTKGYLCELDIGSMYPWTIVSDNIYPKHLGPEWNEGIKQSYFHRANVLKPKLKQLKKGTEEYEEVNSEQAVYKLAMNGGGFGKLGSQYSWQYDELAKYRTTIGGEIKMLKLIEMLYQSNIELVSVNTDGVVIHYSKEEEFKVLKIWKDWEKLTTYTLEDTYYNQIIFSSVNDYIAEICNKEGKILYYKYKGDYEIDKEPHKNNSQRIVPIAIKEYFINKIPLNDIIGKLGYKFINSKGKEEEVCIYDYCIGKKRQKGQLYHYIENNKHTVIHDKVIRYYIVDSFKCQNKIYKEYLDGERAKKAKKNNTKSLEAINKGFNHMLFMNYKDEKDYMIDKLYYKNECMKIIKPIEINTRLLNSPKVEQISLF